MCGIYYNKTKYALKDRTEDTYKNSDGSSMSQVWIGICLEEKTTGTSFWVYTTHLKAKGPFMQVRKAQVEQLLSVVTRKSSLPIIITGDFNDVPTSEALAPF
jgi:endonuclease/exonuclease/phosphatase family metal-dependent hydrolase